MSENAPRPERHNKSRNEIKQVYLAQIVTDDETDLCHRGLKALEEEQLETLTTSLVQEGQATPLTVIETNQFVELNGNQLPLLKLVSGHRRFRSLRAAIESRLDEANIHAQMLVTAVVMVRGEGQTDAEFEQDALVRSVTENETHTKHTAIERLEIVQQFEAAGVPIPRAASALGISPTQYRRDRLIVTESWLYEAVKNGDIGASDAASLAEIAKDKKREKAFKQDFERWRGQKRQLLEAERAEQKKLNRELKGSAAQLKKYIDSSLIKGWKNCLTESRRFTDEAAELSFGVVLDAARKTLTISGVNTPVDKLRSSELAAMIAEMQDGARKLVPIMKQRQQIEQAATVSEDEVEAELAKIRVEQLAREQKKISDESGRPITEAFESEGMVPEDLGSKLDEKIDEVLDQIDADESDGPPTDAFESDDMAPKDLDSELEEQIDEVLDQRDPDESGLPSSAFESEAMVSDEFAREIDEWVDEIVDEMDLGEDTNS